MIGLSLSFCVQDIISGKVREQDVEKIVSGTQCETPEHWDEVISDYSKSYWRDNPILGMKIAWRLVALGKVDQPILRGERPYCISASYGHWVANRFHLQAHPKA